MRTHSLAHSFTDMSTQQKTAGAQQLSGTEANDSMFKPANVEHIEHPGLRNAAKAGGVFLIVIATLASIAYILG